MVNTSSPLSDTEVNTNPRMPKGANWITHLTVREMTSEISCMMLMVAGLAFIFNARPKTTAQNKIPM